jgi:hypothetical protein
MSRVVFQWAWCASQWASISRDGSVMSKHFVICSIKIISPFLTTENGLNFPKSIKYHIFSHKRQNLSLHSYSNCSTSKIL